MYPSLAKYYEPLLMTCSPYIFSNNESQQIWPNKKKEKKSKTWSSLWQFSIISWKHVDGSIFILENCVHDIEINTEINFVFLFRPGGSKIRLILFFKKWMNGLQCKFMFCKFLNCPWFYNQSALKIEDNFFFQSKNGLLNWYS